MGRRLVHDTSSLVCRVLKAKYFPNSSFLDAQHGSNPSYTWTSIHASRDLVRVVTRWKIGMGEDVRVWGFPWINDDSNYYLQGPCPVGLETMRVCELIDDGSNRWDSELIHALFDPDDGACILCTALPPRGVGDRLIWHGNRDGTYSVKSGYRLAASLCYDANLEVPGEWGTLWKLKIPPRVKDFLWRSCWDCLPTRVNLFAKRVGTSKFCAFCNGFNETNWHLFIDCYFAKGCWERSGISHVLDVLVWEVEGYRDLVFRILTTQPSSVVEVFVMVTWQIWKEHNARVWHGNCNTPAQAVFASAVVINEWKAVRQQPPSSALQAGSASSGVGSGCRS